MKQALFHDFYDVSLEKDLLVNLIAWLRYMLIMQTVWRVFKSWLQNSQYLLATEKHGNTENSPQGLNLNEAMSNSNK